MQIVWVLVQTKNSAVCIAGIFSAVCQSQQKAQNLPAKRTLQQLTVVRCWILPEQTSINLSCNKYASVPVCCCLPFLMHLWISFMQHVSLRVLHWNWSTFFLFSFSFFNSHFCHNKKHQPHHADRVSTRFFPPGSGNFTWRFCFHHRDYYFTRLQTPCFWWKFSCCVGYISDLTAWRKINAVVYQAAPHICFQLKDPNL